MNRKQSIDDYLTQTIDQQHDISPRRSRDLSGSLANWARPMLGDILPTSGSLLDEQFPKNEIPDRLDLWVLGENGVRFVDEIEISLIEAPT